MTKTHTWNIYDALCSFRSFPPRYLLLDLHTTGLHTVGSRTGRESHARNDTLPPCDLFHSIFGIAHRHNIMGLTTVFVGRREKRV